MKPLYTLKENAMKRLSIMTFAACCAILCAHGGATMDGTTMILTDDSGTDYRHTTAIPASCTKLIKRGTGQVIITVASLDFKGETVVEEGQLSILNVDSIGRGTLEDKLPLTVKDGATFFMYTPHGSGATSPIFATHAVTISGKGVKSGNNYLGAFRYIPSNGAAYDDYLLASLTLDGDAQVYGETRWGLYGNSSVLNPNGHTITKAGGGAWMLNNCTLGEGYFDIAGGATLQGNVVCAGDPTKSAIKLTWNPLIIYGLTNPFAYPIIVSTERQILADYGADDSFNVFNGDISSVAGAASGAIITLTASGTDRVMTLNGALNATCRIRVENFGNLRLNGGVSATGDEMRIVGRANVSFGGSNASTIKRMYQESGALYVDDGAITVSTGADFGINASGSNVAFLQCGGEVALTSGVIAIGGAGTTIYHQSGGTNISYIGKAKRVGMSSNGGATEFSLSGANTLFKTDYFEIGSRSVASTNIVNLMDGATLAARRFLRYEDTAAGTSVLANSDGGVLKIMFGYGFNNAGPSEAAFSGRNPDHFVLHKNGLVLDSSETTDDIVQLPLKFEAPTGKSIATITLPTDSTFAAAVYKAPARIVFEGAGWGASAYAEYDRSTKRLTGVRIFSGGCDYDATTRVYVESPDRSARYECTYTLADAVGGPLVKRGWRRIDMYAINTYSGGTVVESGALRGMNPGSIPNNAPVRVAADATLDLNGNPLVATTLAGLGRIEGGVTVTDAVEVTCAELFDAAGHLIVNGALTASAGSAIRIVDPENLSAYKDHRRSVAVSATGGISGNFKLQLGNSDSTSGWSLRQNANEVSVKYNKGLVIIFN